MKNKPKITVLMPVYNGEKYLKLAIDSILNQSLKDFIFLIIEDGSTDCSKAIISGYSDARIKFVIHKTNQGLIKTLNEGLDKSKSKYVARMDCDDISMPDRLEQQLKFMESHPSVAACGTTARVIDERGKLGPKMRPLTGRLLSYFYWKPSPLIHPTVILRSSAVGDLRFSAEAVHAEDYDFWLRLSKKAEIRNVTKCLLKYRIHGDSVSAKGRSIQLRSSYNSFIKNIARGKNIGFKQYLSLVSLDYSMVPWERMQTINGLNINIPLYLLLADTIIYSLKRVIYAAKQ